MSTVMQTLKRHFWTDYSPWRLAFELLILGVIINEFYAMGYRR